MFQVSGVRCQVSGFWVLGSRLMAWSIAQSAERKSIMPKLHIRYSTPCTLSDALYIMPISSAIRILTPDT